jgi:NTE family protein
VTAAADGRRKIAIACQGGGSHTAFTAGALKVLLEARVHERFHLVGISGTSGGAICAALVWDALVRGLPRPWEPLMAFWAENTAQGAVERLFNDVAVTTMRAMSSGLLPQVAVAPGSPKLRAIMGAWGAGMRPTFLDFAALLATHVDCSAWERAGVRQVSPVLILGAVNILSGDLRRFASSLEVIRLEHILASCAVPTLFEAVEIDGGAYWDGLYSDNPPITEFTRREFMGDDLIPHEIWVIKINPTTRGAVPTSPETIADRRNELVGNISMFHQLEAIAFLNDLFLQDAFRPEFLERFAIKEPIRVPRGFPDAPPKPYDIPYIGFSKELADSVVYESKLDRSPANIARLMADGERQAREFLAERGYG